MSRKPSRATGKGRGCLYAILAAIALLIIAGIGSCGGGGGSRQTGSTAPAGSPSPASPASGPPPSRTHATTSQAAAPRTSRPPHHVPAGLLVIHDPGEVTGSVTGPCHARDAGRLPDSRCTPGSIDPAVTQADIASTICRDGYTATVRPPEAATEHFKWDESVPAYGFAASVSGELDHLVPLELGGSNDAANLWPEAGQLPNPKDDVEGTLRRAVCGGQVSLAAAQRAIAADWETADSRLGVTVAAAPPAPDHASAAPSSAAQPHPDTTSAAGGGSVVHPGAFCSPTGATGHTSHGTAMRCASKGGAEPRWRSAG